MSTVGIFMSPIDISMSPVDIVLVRDSWGYVAMR